MTPERWQRVEEIFQAALDLTPEDRPRYLTETCANDTALKRDVESLLSQYDSAGELLDQQKARMVELRYFGGLSIEETADVLGVTPTTIKRHWRFAKAWLYGEMQRNC